MSCLHNLRQGDMIGPVIVQLETAKPFFSPLAQESMNHPVPRAGAGCSGIAERMTTADSNSPQVVQ